MVTGGVSADKKVDLKFIQVTLHKIITRMARRLYVFVMSHARFRGNLHSVVA